MLFSWNVIMYLFLAGTGSGAFLVGSACCMIDAGRLTVRTARLAQGVQPAFYIAPVAVGLAIVVLLFDLGHPDRVLSLVRNPFQSVMSVGAWLVALLALVSFTLAVSGTGRRIPRGAQWTLMGAGAVLAAGAMSYTGVLLSSVPSVSFWETGWLVALFVASSLSCGLATVTIADVVAHASPEGSSRDLWTLAGWFTLAEALMLLALLAHGLIAGDTARASVTMLLGGALAVPFWVLLVGAGLLVPASMHLLVRSGFVPLRAARMASSLGVLCGGLALRWCVVAAAVISPLTLTIMQVVP